MITSFIKSIEDSASADTVEYIFKWVEECIQEIKRAFSCADGY